MTDNPMLLAFGAFLTSSGASGLATVVAAGIAVWGINRRISFDRTQAAESDGRDRWWSAYDHLWQRKELVPTTALLSGVGSLSQLAETRQQKVMVALLYASIYQDLQEVPR